MLEIMFDLETLDVKNSAVVLSVGAVAFETVIDGAGDLDYEIADRFYRVLAIDEQLMANRTVSEGTLVWWMQQDPTARAEAFSPVRCPSIQAIEELVQFAEKYEVNKFWAGPAKFDFPIWEDLAFTFQSRVPWRYNRGFCLHSVVNEASYSKSEHEVSRAIHGLPHMPVYDCEWQIDLLTAARNRIARRIL